MLESGPEIRPVDSRVYEEELAPWLPDRILDCHVHISLAENCGPISPERLKEQWAIEAGIFQSWSQLMDRYSALFPLQQVDSLVFGGVLREQDTERENDYIQCGMRNAECGTGDVRGLSVTRPQWPAERIAEALSQGFLGIKPYPDLAPQGAEAPSIFDFVPHDHLTVLNNLRGVMMLHLPRRGRLAEPDNIAELKELRQRYPWIRLIVAHIGRAYCLPTAKKGLPHFADDPGVYFDTAANLNSDVFRYALDTVGPDRILFGSDLPVTMMRGVREHVGETYINYTDGDYSWNINRKSPEEEASYTFFLYEELRALIKAVQAAGMGKPEFDKIMYSNAAALLTSPPQGGEG